MRGTLSSRKVVLRGFLSFPTCPGIHSRHGLCRTSPAATGDQLWGSYFLSRAARTGACPSWQNSARKRRTLGPGWRTMCGQYLHNPSGLSPAKRARLSGHTRKTHSAPFSSSEFRYFSRPNHKFPSAPFARQGQHRYFTGETAGIYSQTT